MNFAEKIEEIEAKIASFEKITPAQLIETDVELAEIELVDIAEFFQSLRMKLHDIEITDEIEDLPEPPEEEEEEDRGNQGQGQGRNNSNSRNLVPPRRK